MIEHFDETRWPSHCDSVLPGSFVVSARAWAWKCLLIPKRNEICAADFKVVNNNKMSNGHETEPVDIRIDNNNDVWSLSSTSNSLSTCDASSSNDKACCSGPVES